MNTWNHITVQTNDYYSIELLLLEETSWNHLSVYKLFVLRIVTWSYICLLMFIISYLKTY